MRDLTRFLNGLRSTLPEVPIEPELKPEREDHDRSIRCAWWSPGREQPGWWLGQYEQSPSAPANREEQDLAAGAVLQAVTEDGEGHRSPQAGDLGRFGGRGSGPFNTFVTAATRRGIADE